MEVLANWLCMQLYDTSLKGNKDQQEVLKKSLLEAERGTEKSLVFRYKYLYFVTIVMIRLQNMSVFNFSSTERKSLCFVFDQYKFQCMK